MSCHHKCHCHCHKPVECPSASTSCSTRTYARLDKCGRVYINTPNQEAVVAVTPVAFTYSGGSASTFATLQSVSACRYAQISLVSTVTNTASEGSAVYTVTLLRNNVPVALTSNTIYAGDVESFALPYSEPLTSGSYTYTATIQATDSATVSNIRLSVLYQ